MVAPVSKNIDFIVKDGLQVGANVAVGTSFAGVVHAPIDGMIVSGFVGIGSAVPTTQLSVAGNVSLFNNGSTLGGIIFPDGTWQYSAATHAAAGASGSIQFNDGNGNFAYSPNLEWDITNSRLGVGTNTPLSVLHVTGSSPALISTENSGGEYEINVGVDLSTGSALGYNSSSSYGYLKIIGQSEILQWNNVGLGLNGVTPVNTLDVSGGAVIGGGALYAGSATAPTNGLLVQGAVGLGMTGTPAGKLDIRPGSGQAGLFIKNPSSSAIDFVRLVDSSNNPMFTINNAGNVTVGTWAASTITADHGGTGLSSYTLGDMLYATSSTTALSKLPLGGSGNILVSNGSAPTWGTIDLSNASAVGSSILGLNNGGTNADLSGSVSNGGIVWSNASQMQILAASATSGNVLISGGAGTPSWGQYYTTSNVPNSIVSRDGSGNFIAGKITANTGFQGGYASVSALNASGAAIVNSLSSNGTVSGTVITANTGFEGGYASVTTLNASSDAYVNTLTSNGKVSGTMASFTSLYSSGTATVSSLSSNGAVSGTVITANTGFEGGYASVTTLNASSDAYVNTLSSNGAVSGTTIGGTVITATTGFQGGYASVGALNASGTAIVNSLTSNGAISGTTLSGTSATVTSLQSSGTATVQTLTSNTTVSGNSFVIGGTVTGLGGTSAVTVDTWSTSLYRTVHYVAQVTDVTNSQYQASQFMIIHDGTSSYKSEYNIMYTASNLGSFDAHIDGLGNMVVTFTANSATAKTIKVIRTGVNI